LSAKRIILRAAKGESQYHLGEVVLGLVVIVRRVEESFGRDAANVQAGASELAPLLHTDNLHAHLTRLDGCRGRGKGEVDIFGKRNSSPKIHSKSGMRDVG
jgi:hypothetical protein